MAWTFFASGKLGPITKGVVTVLVLSAVGTQFLPGGHKSIHFLVPLFLPLFVCGWYYFTSPLE